MSWARTVPMLLTGVVMLAGCSGGDESSQSETSSSTSSAVSATSSPKPSESSQKSSPGGDEPIGDGGIDLKSKAPSTSYPAEQLSGPAPATATPGEAASTTVAASRAPTRRRPWPPTERQPRGPRAHPRRSAATRARTIPMRWSARALRRVRASTTTRQSSSTGVTREPCSRADRHSTICSTTRLPFTEKARVNGLFGSSAHTWFSLRSAPSTTIVPSSTTLMLLM